MNSKMWSVLMVLVGMGCMIIVLLGMLFGDDFVRGFNIGMAEAMATSTPLPTNTPVPTPTIVPTPTLIPNCQKGWLCSTNAPPQCYGWSGENGAVRLSNEEMAFVLNEPGFHFYFEAGAFFEDRILVEADFCQDVKYMP